MCGSEKIKPLMPGKAERVVTVNNAALRMTDVTFDGFYVYPYDAIHPGCGTVTLQVAEYQGRFLLRDGYHRAYGFLRRGIHRVPAFVRRFARFQEMNLPAGLLSQEAYMGERPPILTDYADDIVAADVSQPAVQKIDCDKRA